MTALATRRRYPRATLIKTGDRRWTTEDGYAVRAVSVHDDGRYDYRIYTPGAAKPRAVCAHKREAREAIEALRATEGRYAHPWIAFPNA